MGAVEVVGLGLRERVIEQGVECGAVDPGVELPARPLAGGPTDPGGLGRQG